MSDLAFLESSRTLLKYISILENRSVPNTTDNLSQTEIQVLKQSTNKSCTIVGPDALNHFNDLIICNKITKSTDSIEKYAWFLLTEFLFTA